MCGAAPRATSHWECSVRWADQAQLEQPPHVTGHSFRARSLPRLGTTRRLVCCLRESDWKCSCRGDRNDASCDHTLVCRQPYRKSKPGPRRPACPCDPPLVPVSLLHRCAFPRGGTRITSRWRVRLYPQRCRLLFVTLSAPRSYFVALQAMDNCSVATSIVPVQVRCNSPPYVYLPAVEAITYRGPGTEFSSIQINGAVANPGGDSVEQLADLPTFR